MIVGFLLHGGSIICRPCARIVRHAEIDSAINAKDAGARRCYACGESLR